MASGWGVAEAGKIGSLPDAIAIVDPGGYLVYFERMQDAHLGSVQFAIDKARSAVLFRRPTKQLLSHIFLNGPCAASG
jgi:glc operon protein GlcG